MSEVSLLDDWTVGEIKGYLRAAPTIADVNDVAVHFARHVLELERSKDQKQRTFAIQIKNMAVWRRNQIQRERRK